MSLRASNLHVDDQFSVEVHRDQHATIVVPRGELDLASAPKLEAELMAAWESGVELVIVDLRCVDFMDSTGLRVVIEAHQRARDRARRFGVVDGGDQVHKLLTMTGTLNALGVAASPDELLDG